MPNRLNEQCCGHSEDIASTQFGDFFSVENRIRNPNITPDSLVFVTPTSSTLNPIFVKEQSEGEIIVGFDIPANNDVTFNWWLVELVADATE